MSVEVNWQTTRPTVRERTKFLLNNKLFSDVKFVVRKSDGESESKEVISAHKFVLSIGSPVFEAMFYGELAETRDSIELPDCEYESLLELFRHMYSDEVNLSGSNVMGVLYLAKKYMVPLLIDKCTEYLQNNLDPSNVFSILPTAEKYEEKNLVDRCWKVIDKQTETAVKSDGFATIERSLLEALVARDTLSIKEVDLFQAVDNWATKQCEKQGLTVNGELKRRILDEKIIKAIRFPLMKQEEFAAVVLQKKIFTLEEVTSFFQFFSLKSSPPLGFSDTRRSGVSYDICRCSRFKSVDESRWHYTNGLKDVIIFAVDIDIMLHGLCLFGRLNNHYTVTIEVKDIGNNLTRLVSKSGTFSSELLQHNSGNYYGFEVFFDSAINVKKNVEYRIEALVAGPPSSRGYGGFASVLSSGVTFRFSQTSQMQETNGTNQTIGQFPQFLFSV